MQNRAGRRADRWEGTMGELCKEGQGLRSSVPVLVGHQPKNEDRGMG
jgi:hypothetical protein